MNKLLFLLMPFFLTNQSFPQTIIFDEVISVNLHEGLETWDTIMNESKMLGIQSKDPIYGYLITRIKLDSKENDLNTLPSNIFSLKRTYKELFQGYNRTIIKTGFVFVDSSIMNYDGFIALKFLFKNNNLGGIINESMMLILNEYLYVFTYAGLNNQEYIGLGYFLKSITINTSNKTSQIIGESIDYKIGYVLGGVLFIVILLLILKTILKSIKKSKSTNA